MKKILLALLCLSLVMETHAQDDETIDISGNNTDKSYISYSTPVNIADGKTVNVRSALRHRDIVNTGITQPVQTVVDRPSVVYDLSGRAVGNGNATLKSGLYISNGRKWVVR